MERSILDAVSSGDIKTLQQLFTKCGIQPGSKDFHPTFIDPNDPQGEPTSLPSTWDLLECAAAAKQAAMTKIVLQPYPAFTLSQGQSIARAIMDNPDTEVLQVLIDHDPSFASLTMDYGMETFLTEACYRPPEQIVPVLHLLLDSGADVNDGWPGRGGGALWSAICGGQPVEILRKILDRGCEIKGSTVGMAVQKRRADVVEFLLSHGRCRLDEQEEEYVKRRAEEIGDKEIIQIVYAWSQPRMARREAAERWRKSLCGRLIGQLFGEVG